MLFNFLLPFLGLPFLEAFLRPFEVSGLFAFSGFGGVCFDLGVSTVFESFVVLGSGRCITRVLGLSLLAPVRLVVVQFGVFLSVKSFFGLLFDSDPIT